MTAKSTLLETRFMLNMSRINGLMQLQYANFTPKPEQLLLGEDGPRADIFRAIVVFLHSTFEVLLRSHIPKPNQNVNFYSRTDLDKALKRSRIDSTPFKPLYPPLIQMAKRRTRIVHDADLSNRTATICEPWRAADEWQLGMWFMAVAAFYYQLRISVNAASIVERAAYDKHRKAMTQHVDFGRELAAFFAAAQKLSAESRIEALQKLQDKLACTLATLRLDARDFI